MHRFAGTTYESAVEYVELFFEEHGSELYEIDNKSLNQWHKMFIAFEKLYKYEYTISTTFKIEHYDIDTNLLHNKMKTIDDCIHENFYRLYTYEPSIETIWKDVKNALEKWYILHDK